MAHQRSSAIEHPAEQRISIRLIGVEDELARVLILPNPSDRYVLRTPSLDLLVSGDEVMVVTDTFSTVYGAGDDLDTATRDSVMSLFDHFADLEAEEAILAPGLQRELATLRQYILRAIGATSGEGGASAGR